MSQKRMAVSLAVLELQKQKWTGEGAFYPLAAGIRVNSRLTFALGRTV